MSSSVRTTLHFSVSPPLPSGLKLDEEKGTIAGVSPAETGPTEYELKVLLGMNAHNSQAATSFCTFRLQTVAAPAGLSYAAIEKVFNGPATEDDRLGSLPPVRPMTSFAGSRKLQSLRSPPAIKFQASPTVDHGSVLHYEIEPQLPRGMSLDQTTGVISGLPEHRFPSAKGQTYEVFGYNEVGMTGCKVHLEVLGGHWNLVNVKLHTVGAPEVPMLPMSDSFSATPSLPDRYSEGGSPMSPNTPGERRGSFYLSGEEEMAQDPSGPALAAAWTGRACPGMAAEVDWGAAMDKVAIILQKFGNEMLIREPGGVAGMKLVKGMMASALVPHLGLQDDPHHTRRLVRLVEQRGRTTRHHPGGAPGAIGRGPGAEVAIASEDAIAAGDAVVYLRRAAGLSLPPPPKLPVPLLGEGKQAWEPSAYRLAASREDSPHKEPWASKPGFRPQSGRTQNWSLPPSTAPSAPNSARGLRSETTGPPLLRQPLEKPPNSARQVRRSRDDYEQDSMKVNEEFTKMLPLWRNKLTEQLHPVRLEAWQRWRAPLNT